eukprot:Clim_evm32s225 gene=Clim_evmTU32s225
MQLDYETHPGEEVPDPEAPDHHGYSLLPSEQDPGNDSIVVAIEDYQEFVEADTEGEDEDETDGQVNQRSLSEVAKDLQDTTALHSMDDEKAETIKSIMSHISLDESAIPPWAKNLNSRNVEVEEEGTPEAWLKGMLSHRQSTRPSSKS